MRSAVKPGHRVRALGAGAVLTLSAVLTSGCGLVGEDSTVAQTVKEAVQTPQEKLLAATVTSETEPYAYTVVQKGDPADAQDLSGAVDPAGKAYELGTVHKDEELDYTLKLDYRVIDQKSWFRVKFEGAEDLDVPELPEKWMAIDPTKVTDEAMKGFRGEEDQDPAQLNALLTTTSAVTEEAGGKFAGTFDLTQQPDTDIVVPATRKALGEKGKALPFTATVTSGKVTQFVLSIPATSVSKAQTFTVNYSKFGAVAPIAAPTAAETAETPATAYELLNG
jgi:hypothetical protein